MICLVILFSSELDFLFFVQKIGQKKMVVKSKNVHSLKSIQDKISAVLRIYYFWLTNFKLIFAADFQANPHWHHLQKVMKN